MSGEFGTGKTIFVLAIVVGCFAVLWPKIFYPMLTASVTQPSSGRQEGIGPHARPERPAHLYPEMMHPALREKGRQLPQRTIEKQARPGPMPGVRPPMGGAGGIVPPPQTKGSGAMGIIMPLYTVGIVVFFVYTIMKVLFKKGQDDDKTPKLKDFGLDPEYRKYVFAEEYLDNADISTKDQMRRQVREESRNRKKAQNDIPPETKIGKSECEKTISGILSELDQFSNEIEAQKKKKLEELARLMEMEKEEKKKEEEASSSCIPQAEDDEFLDALTTRTSTDQEQTSLDVAVLSDTPLHSESLVISNTPPHDMDSDIEEVHSFNADTDESSNIEDASIASGTQNSDQDLFISLETKQDTGISDTITKILTTQCVMPHIPAVSESIAKPVCNSDPCTQVLESSDRYIQRSVPEVLFKEQIPSDFKFTNINSSDIPSKQQSTTYPTNAEPLTVNPPSTPKVTNHITTSNHYNKQTSSTKESYSTKQNSQPHLPQEQQNTNVSHTHPTKKPKHSTPPCNNTQQPSSTPTNKQKNKRKRSRKRGKKRGGSAWPSALSINPVIDRVEEVGEMTSEEDVTSSEALTTTLSEDTSLPASLQRHLEEIQKNEDSPTSSKGSSPDMDEYEVITKEEDQTTTAIKEENSKEEAANTKKTEEPEEVDNQSEDKEIKDKEEEMEAAPDQSSPAKETPGNAATKSTEEISDNES